MARRKVRMGETWVESEDPYYGPERKGYVRFADGKLRTVRLAMSADTVFSIRARPSHGPAGIVMVDPDREEFCFHNFTFA